MTTDGAGERTIDLDTLLGEHLPSAVTSLRMTCGLSLRYANDDLEVVRTVYIEAPQDAPGKRRKWVTLTPAIIDRSWKETLALLGEALDRAYDAKFEGGE